MALQFLRKLFGRPEHPPTVIVHPHLADKAFLTPFDDPNSHIRRIDTPTFRRSTPARFVPKPTIHPAEPETERDYGSQYFNSVLAADAASVVDSSSSWNSDSPSIDSSPTSDFTDGGSSGGGGASGDW